MLHASSQFTSEVVGVALHLHAVLHTTWLHRAVACCFCKHTYSGMPQFDKTLNTEQKRIDFRPPEDLPPPLDRPTDACLFTTAFMTAAAKAVQLVLRGSNCAAVLTEVCYSKCLVQLSLTNCLQMRHPLCRPMSHMVMLYSYAQLSKMCLCACVQPE